MDKTKENRVIFKEFIVKQTDCTLRDGWPCVSCAANFFGKETKRPNEEGFDEYMTFVSFWQNYALEDE